MRRALRFYADKSNWIDGAPILASQREDNGFTARYGLRLDDYYSEPLVRPAEEGNTNETSETN